ncbi:MAG: DNA translocase FtsK [Anaerolineales bacterium]|nr:MAG: DNA translocase FtsK [Anaerolineales bacterium]
MTKRSSARGRRKSAPKSKGKSTSTRSRSTRKSSSQNQLSAGLQSVRERMKTPERKQDLRGLLLVVVGALTTLGMFIPRDDLLGFWNRLLGQIFGWGVFLVPLVLIVMGSYRLLRRWREHLPRVEPEQILGGILLYILLLTLLQASVGTTDFQAGLAQARLGRGGGLLGAATLSILVGGLGAGGTTVVLVAWFLMALTFSVGISLPELFSFVGRAWVYLRGQFSVPAEKRPTVSPPSSEHPVRRAEAPRENIEPPRPVTPTAASAGNGQAVIAAPEADPTPGKPDWVLPDLTEILEPGDVGRADETFDRERARLIEETLKSFGAPARVVEVNRGPVITQFGVEPEFIEGRGNRRIKVKVSKISALADDLALALAAPSIRIEAPVPGKGFVGIEVPNTEVSLVALRDIMESKHYQKMHSRLSLGLGKDVSGRPVASDLTTMPHLLIAGTTGSGKSVCVNAIISCLLLQNTPDQLKFVMVDPKRVELTYFNGIPHLLAPVVVDLERVVPALQWVTKEMDRRYHLFAKEGVRNIADFNQRMVQVQHPEMHYIVVVIDELADLMMLAPDETERVITRLAQLARATGIHLVIATQRPSVDVVTGLIKANFPARVAFAVASSVDSRVILDHPGAERLLGRGDMLFQSPDAPAPLRMQGAYVSEVELNRLIRYWKIASLDGVETRPSSVSPAESLPFGVPLKQVPMWEDDSDEDSDLDSVYAEAVQVVREMRRASISLLQRRLRIGYTRAARLVDQLEEQGVIGPAQSGSQPREVLDYGSLSEPDLEE